MPEIILLVFSETFWDKCLNEIQHNLILYTLWFVKFIRIVFLKTIQPATNHAIFSDMLIVSW